MLTKKSIKTKLIVLFVGSVVFTHLLLAVGFHIAVNYHFLEQDYKKIDDKVLNLFPDFVNRKVTLSAFYYLSLSTVNIWVVRDAKQEYTNAKIALPEGSLPVFHKIKDIKQPFTWVDDGDTHRAFAFTINDDDLLVAGMNINDQLIFSRNMNWIIFGFLSITAALSILHSIFSVNYSLKPLKTFEGYLKRVKPGHLDVRIPSRDLPVELEELACVQNNMLDRLEKGFQRLSEFSSDIAHELRTPLTNITTQTQVTLTRKRDCAEYEDVLIANIEELERITKTINDTLYLAKSENALLHRENQQLNLCEEISDIIEYFSIIGDDKNMTFTLYGDGELYFDKTMFRRIINNLLSNAVRHAYPDSTIYVNIERSTESVDINIRNTGDTIPEDSIPFIFDRFYRADKSRDHHHSVGAGLGLAIARSIIEAYHGEISVTSKVGVTTFTINLPLAYCSLER
ncbi:MAG: heavy metal sensor histidine kinase [Thiolinea sp.]